MNPHDKRMMWTLMFASADLRVRYDRDHYKRLALRTKLRQAGMLRHAMWRMPPRRGLGAASWDNHARVVSERARRAHNDRVFARYERRAVPSPFVTAMRAEIRGFVVDLEQMGREFNRRVLRDSLRRQWRYRILWPLVKWFAVKYAVAIALPNDKGRV